MLSNFELPLQLKCYEIDIKVVISIKYGWNTIVWAKIRHLRHFVQNLLGVKVLTSNKISKFCWQNHCLQHGFTWFTCYWIYLLLKNWIYLLHVLLIKFLHLLFLEKTAKKTPKNCLLQWYTKHYIILAENWSTYFL